MRDAQQKYGNANSARGASAPRRRAQRARPFLGALREYAVFYCALLLLAAVCLGWAPCAAILRMLLSPHAGRRVGRAVIRRLWHAYFRMLDALGACHVDLSELDALRGQPAMILAPNHPCLLDAMLIASRVPNLGCVMKAELLKNPFLGASARLAGYIVNHAPHSTIKRAVAELRQGNLLLLFPEGTRTERTPLNPLKGGVALIAARARVPLQTLIIETDSPFLGKGWRILKKPELPVVYRVRLGRRFAPPLNTPATEQAFMEELQHYYTAELNRDGASGVHPGQHADRVKTDAVICAAPRRTERR